MMENQESKPKEFDFNSEEWKEQLKGKSPEEIAEIVGAHYEAKYGRVTAFPAARIIAWGIFCLFLVSILIFLYHLFKKVAP